MSELRSDWQAEACPTKDTQWGGYATLVFDCNRSARYRTMLFTSEVNSSVEKLVVVHDVGGGVGPRANAGVRSRVHQTFRADHTPHGGCREAARPNENRRQTRRYRELCADADDLQSVR